MPDSMYIDAVRERLHHHDCLQSGWLLDGFPHTMAQVCLVPLGALAPLVVTSCLSLTTACCQRTLPIHCTVRRYHAADALTVCFALGNLMRNAEGWVGSSVF